VSALQASGGLFNPVPHPLGFSFVSSHQELLCHLTFFSSWPPTWQQDEDSPALTHNHATAAQGTAPDLMSPMRCHLPPAPPLFTPSSSGEGGLSFSNLPI
jgi:hypothetical protein